MKYNAIIIIKNFFFFVFACNVSITLHFLQRCNDMMACVCNVFKCSLLKLHTYLGHLVSHVRMGHEIQKIVKSFPALSLVASIQPITRTVLKVHLTITPDFEWNDRFHGTSSEPWWIWVEDAENNHMYHSEYFLLQKKQVHLRKFDCEFKA